MIKDFSLGFRLGIIFRILFLLLFPAEFLHLVILLFRK